MTEQTREERIAAALSELGTQVRQRAARPAPGVIRGLAEHRRRVRRTAAAALAAAAVLALAVGGVSVVRGSATPPPSDPASTVTPSPSPSPRVSRSVPPWPEPKVGDPIGATDWDNAAIALPRHDGCPSGAVTFQRRGEELSGPSSWPRVVLDADSVAYGDLTGDGRPEAIMSALCRRSAEDSGDGEGQLLVVAREADGLRALAWVGPRGALFVGQWVAGGHLYVDVHPWYQDWGYSLGAAQVYRWTGSAFAAVDGAAEYPGLTSGHAVDLTPMAGLTGCPTPVLRFGRDGRAEDAGTTFHLDQPAVPDHLPHLVDLDGDGRRHLLVAITCDRPEDDSDPDTGAVVVLERQPGGGFHAIDAIRPPDGSSLSGWSYDRGKLTIETADQAGVVAPLTYTWNGDYFQL